MPFSRLTPSPGIDVERSPSANRGGFSYASLIRWREGLVEVLLGWAALCATALIGTCRALHYWNDLLGNAYTAAGTNTHLFVEQAGTLYDITPAAGFTPGAVSSGPVSYSLLVWSLDNFGQDLVAVPSQQGVFIWTPTDPPTGNATQIATAPAANQGAFVSMSAQIIVAYGCTPVEGAPPPLDPLLVRWCDASDFTDWVASPTNQAGSYRLPRGNRIIGGIQAPGVGILWTDLDVWSQQYIGFPLVYGFFQISSSCGLIAQKAATILGPTVYWMSDHGFFSLSGSGASQIPCSVWDIVYKNLDQDNQDKCLAGSNYHYSEVWWFFPSLAGGSGEIDSYVKYNIMRNEWDFGAATTGVPNQMARTAWTDQNRPGDPYSVDLTNLIQEQEVGFTADGGAPIAASVRTAYQDLGDGRDYFIVDQFLPDFLWAGPNPSFNLTIYFRDYPGDAPTEMGPFLVTPATEYITLRLATPITIGGTTVTAYPAPRAREIAVQIDNISGWWRWGAPRLRISPGGRL